MSFDFRFPCGVRSAGCLAAAVMVGLSLGVTETRAQCLPNPASDGDDVVCTGTSDGFRDDGFDDGTVTIEEDAVITDNDQGIEVDDDVEIVNDGSVTSTGDHAIQGDNGVTVTNNGTLSGANDGINVDNDGFVVNNGDITGGDDGIQVEENSTVINNGTINAAAEGINANNIGATVVNNGEITSVDDGINAGTGATIINNGRITVTGDQDGIDLDDGTVLNTGIITALGTEDGVDFDENGTAPSMLTNTGVISGNIAVNADGADTQEQTILNTGTLIGKSGTAVALQGGNDTLRVGTGSLVDGVIDLGTEDDMFEIVSPVAGVYRFVSMPGVETNGFNAIVTSTSVIAIDSSPFTALDASISEFGMDLSRAIGTAPAADDLVWARAFGGWAEFDPATMTQGFGLAGGGFVAGRNWDHGADTLGFFAGGAIYGAWLDDDIHDTRFLAGYGGVRATRQLAPDLTLIGNAWIGAAEASIESSVLASGDGSTTGLIGGLDGGFVFAPAGMPVVVEGAAGYNGFFGNSMVLDSLGARIAGVSSHHFHASLEAGVPLEFAGGTLTPFVRLEADAVTGGNLSATAGGTTINLGDNDVVSGVGIFGGAKLSLAGAGGSRISASLAVGTDTASTLSVDGRVTLAVPF